MAEMTKTAYTVALTKFFRDFDRIKERLKRTPTAKELGPLPKPGAEDIDNAKRYRMYHSGWRGARVEPEPTTYKVRY